MAFRTLAQKKEGENNLFRLIECQKIRKEKKLFNKRWENAVYFLFISRINSDKWDVLLWLVRSLEMASESDSDLS